VEIEKCLLDGLERASHQLERVQEEKKQRDDTKRHEISKSRRETPIDRQAGRDAPSDRSQKREKY